MERSPEAGVVSIAFRTCLSIVVTGYSLSLSLSLVCASVQQVEDDDTFCVVLSIRF